MSAREATNENYSGAAALAFTVNTGTLSQATMKDASVTMFDSSYSTHTDFVIGLEDDAFDDGDEFGSKRIKKYTFPRTGDLIAAINVQLDMPGLVNVNSAGKIMAMSADEGANCIAAPEAMPYYKKNCALKALEMCTLKIGDQTVVELRSRFLQIASEICSKPGHEKAFRMHCGDYSNAHDDDAASVLAQKKMSRRFNRCIVELPTWFTLGGLSQAIPSVSVSYHNIDLEVECAELSAFIENLNESSAPEPAKLSASISSIADNVVTFSSDVSGTVKAGGLLTIAGSATGTEDSDGTYKVASVDAAAVTISTAGTDTGIDDMATPPNTTEASFADSESQDVTTYVNAGETGYMSSNGAVALAQGKRFEKSDISMRVLMRCVYLSPEEQSHVFSKDHSFLITQWRELPSERVTGPSHIVKGSTAFISHAVRMLLVDFSVQAPIDPLTGHRRQPLKSLFYSANSIKLAGGSGSALSGGPGSYDLDSFADHSTLSVINFSVSGLRGFRPTGLLEPGSIANPSLQCQIDEEFLAANPGVELDVAYVSYNILKISRGSAQVLLL